MAGKYELWAKTSFSRPELTRTAEIGVIVLKNFERNSKTNFLFDFRPIIIAKNLQFSVFFIVVHIFREELGNFWSQEF